MCKTRNKVLESIARSEGVDVSPRLNVNILDGGPHFAVQVGLFSCDHSHVMLGFMFCSGTASVMMLTKASCVHLL